MLANGMLSNTGLSNEQIQRFLHEHSQNFNTHSNSYTQDHYRSLSAKHRSHSVSASY